MALRGSWNRSVPTGYKVIRIPMEGGARAWGRPVGVITGKDDAFYLSDDRAGTISRISFSSR